MFGLSGLRGLVCASLVVSLPAGAAERADKFTPACAERDLRAISFIDRHGDAGDVPTAALAEAGLAYLQARLSCLLGNEALALAMYDRIPRLAIASDPED